MVASDRFLFDGIVRRLTRCDVVSIRIELSLAGNVVRYCRSCKTIQVVSCNLIEMK